LQQAVVQTACWSLRVIVLEQVAVRLVAWLCACACGLQRAKEQKHEIIEQKTREKKPYTAIKFGCKAHCHAAAVSIAQQQCARAFPVPQRIIP
jgi:hypothetical protein